jgi:protein-tyrosine phosphatase
MQDMQDMQAKQVPLQMTQIPLNLPSQVYRGAMPFSKFNPEPEIFGEMQKRKITHVVVLCTSEECLKHSNRDLIEAYKTNNFRVTHFPIQNYGVPNTEDLKKLVGPLYKELSETDTNNTYIHCMGGKGRTGLVIACLARVALNMNGEEAINLIREHIKGAIETPEQENLVKSFHL